MRQARGDNQVIGEITIVTRFDHFEKFGEHDAFGNVIFSSGASATSFQHRFSTKPQDAESGLY